VFSYANHYKFGIFGKFYGVYYTKTPTNTTPAEIS